MTMRLKNAQKGLCNQPLNLPRRLEMSQKRNILQPLICVCVLAFPIYDALMCESRSRGIVSHFGAVTSVTF